MTAARARRLLELAAKIGAAPPDQGEGDEARLRHLIDSGVLSPATLADLERELGADEEPDEGFELESKVGEGGMGEVWRARDLRLNRLVALKLLRRDDAAASARFLREAQAQARLEHPHVCRVYGTGEHEGRPYIAMQLVDGPTLAHLAPSLELRPRLKLVRQAAMAVAAAHTAGIVHRDLKPGNILVSKEGDHAWVTDFGLARDLGGGTPITRELVGTPEFMPPEQARGDEVDARTDVWALGATLFAVLAGRPPFVGSPGQVVEQVLSRDAPPLRSLRPELPLDLSTIVDRCLEREPDRRYPSAASVAADLGRFLDGEPIVARPLSVPSRILRRLRRRPGRLLAAVGVAATLAAAAVVVQTRRTAARDARLTARFAETAATIEADLRQAYLMPAHDLTPQIDDVVARLAEIEAARPALDGEAAAAADEAVGRGRLALGDGRAARRALERAWGEGRRGPETALALALARAQEYRRELADLPLVPTRKEREARRAKLAATMGAETVRALQAARSGNARRVAYAEGLLAYFEERFPDALGHAEAALAREPSFYEALLLEGEVHVAEGRAHDAGSRPDDARRAYDAAAATFRRAREIGRSAPELVFAECRRGYERIYSLSTAGQDPAAITGEVIAACAELGRLVPRDTRGLLYASWAAGSTFVAGLRKHQGVEPWLTTALALARTAVAIDPRAPRPLIALGSVLSRKGQYEIDLGAPGGEADLAEAVTVLERARTLAQEPSTAPRHLGIVLQTLAQLDDTRGRDPRPNLERAEAALAEALAQDPTDEASLDAIGLVEERRALWEHAHGGAWRPIHDRAIERLTRAAEARKASPHGWETLAWTWNRRAEMERGDGGDPRPACWQAIAMFRKLDASSSQTLTGLGAVWSVLASDALDHGEDARWALAESLPLVERAVAAMPSYAGSYVNSANTHWLAARSALARGEDPEPEVGKALDRITRGAELDPANALLAYLEGAAWLVRAEDALDHGRSAAAALARAASALERAQKLDADEPQGVATVCNLHVLRARATGDPAAVAAGLATAARIGSTADGLECAARLTRDVASWQKVVARDPRRAARLRRP